MLQCFQTFHPQHNFRGKRKQPENRTKHSTMLPPTSSPSTSSASPLIIQAARRLLLDNSSPYLSTSNQAAPPVVSLGDDSSHPYNSFDAYVVMVLSLLLCATLCALGLNLMIRGALRLSNGVSYVNGDSSETKLASTGVKGKALESFPVVTYLAGMKLPGSDTECVICLSEFATGERLRVLPHCSHGFHIQCIDKWLMEHTSCPTCRCCLIDTCQKIVGCTQARLLEPPPASVAQLLPGTVVPLEHEDFLHSMHDVC